MYTDISRAATPPTIYESQVAKGIMKREGTPEAITYFSENCERLGNYSYWFLLSTCWVSYSGHSDLNLWKELFSSTRSKRKQSIMKPSELKAFERLPYFFTVYRAHRADEQDWIAYTLERSIAERFAKERGTTVIKEYRVKKRDVLALFLRRKEQEIIVLDKNKIELLREIDIVAE